MAIKLEVGKRYVSRDGSISTPVRVNPHAGEFYKFHADLDGYQFGYGDDGRAFNSPNECDEDLIALAPDEAPTGEAALDALTELDQLRARVKEAEDAMTAWSRNAATNAREADALRAENARLREMLGQIIERSNNGTLGTSKVNDMRELAAQALARTGAENG